MFKRYHAASQEEQREDPEDTHPVERLDGKHDPPRVHVAWVNLPTCMHLSCRAILHCPPLEWLTKPLRVVCADSERLYVPHVSNEICRFVACCPRRILGAPVVVCDQQHQRRRRIDHLPTPTSTRLALRRLATRVRLTVCSHPRGRSCCDVG